jgi:hypothetical protein
MQTVSPYVSMQLIDDQKLNKKEAFFLLFSPNRSSVARKGRFFTGEVHKN